MRLLFIAMVGVVVVGIGLTGYRIIKGDPGKAPQGNQITEQVTVLRLRRVPTSEVGPGQLFYVHVLERDDLDRGHEAHPGFAVHVPDPGVVQLELYAGSPADVMDGLVDLVGEVEAPFGLDHVAVGGRDVAVLLEQLMLDLGFVLFEVVRAHDFIVRGDGDELPRDVDRAAKTRSRLGRYGAISCRASP